MPKVSVVIPTYRHAEFVGDAVETALAQTSSEVEVIVVNDGSPDETRRVLDPFIAAAQIRYIEQSNAGQAAARNRGIEMATGEFVAFLDDDDLWPRDNLSEHLRALKSSGADVSVASCYRFGPNRLPNRLQPVGPAISVDSLFSGNPITSPGQVVVRRTMLKLVGSFDPDLWGTDDWDLWFRLATRARFVVSDRIGLYYRDHATNASRNAARMFQNALQVMDRNLGRADPRRRAALRRIAYRTLFIWYGTDCVVSLKRAIWAGDVLGILACARLLYPLAAQACDDPFLLRSIFNALMPRTQCARLGEWFIDSIRGHASAH
jgi:glycosyltransferase involved in cell wall biosynthesis